MLVAARAADGLVGLDVGAHAEAGLGQRLLADHGPLLAVGAELSRQALGDDAVDRRRGQEALDPHLLQADDRARGVVRVQGRQHHVPGERGLDRDPRGLAVADLADHDHVGVRAEDRAQPGGEGEAGLAVDADLVDALEAVLDRVLDRDDVALDGVDLVQRRVERRRLARARSGR